MLEFYVAALARFQGCLILEKWTYVMPRGNVSKEVLLHLPLIKSNLNYFWTRDKDGFGG